MGRELPVGILVKIFVGITTLSLVSCVQVQRLAAKTPAASLVSAKNVALAIEDTPYCPGFLPERDTASQENPPLVPSGIGVGEYCRTAALTPGSLVLIKDGPGQRKEYCPCPSNRCDAYGHPALLGKFNDGKKRIEGASKVAMTGSEECGWPTNKAKTRDALTTIPGYIADGAGKEGHTCNILAYVPTCGNAGSCCEGGRLTGRPLLPQRIADSKDPQVNFKVCNEVASRKDLKGSLCSMPLQTAASAGIWNPNGKAVGSEASSHITGGHGSNSAPSSHGSHGGHDACWAEDQSNADGIVQAHCHDGGELVRNEAGDTAIGGHRECHLVRKGIIPGQLDVFTFLVDCGADGGSAISHHKVDDHQRDGLSAKLLTHEELEHQLAGKTTHTSPAKAHKANKGQGHRSTALPKLIDDSEW